MHSFSAKSVTGDLCALFRFQQMKSGSQNAENENCILAAFVLVNRADHGFFLMEFAPVFK
jgi:hypothetical protein